MVDILASTKAHGQERFAFLIGVTHGASKT
jgi:hypothetical protein